MLPKYPNSFHGIFLGHYRNTDLYCQQRIFDNRRIVYIVGDDYMLWDYIDHYVDTINDMEALTRADLNLVRRYELLEAQKRALKIYNFMLPS